MSYTITLRTPRFIRRVLHDWKTRNDCKHENWEKKEVAGKLGDEMVLAGEVKIWPADLEAILVECIDCGFYSMQIKHPTQRAGVVQWKLRVEKEEQ